MLPPSRHSLRTCFFIPKLNFKLSLNLLCSRNRPPPPPQALYLRALAALPCEASRSDPLHLPVWGCSLGSWGIVREIQGFGHHHRHRSRRLLRDFLVSLRHDYGDHCCCCRCCCSHHDSRCFAEKLQVFQAPSPELFFGTKTGAAQGRSWKVPWLLKAEEEECSSNTMKGATRSETVCHAKTYLVEASTQST